MAFNSEMIIQDIRGQIEQMLLSQTASSLPIELIIRAHAASAFLAATPILLPGEKSLARTSDKRHIPAPTPLLGSRAFAACVSSSPYSPASSHTSDKPPPKLLLAIPLAHYAWLRPITSAPAIPTNVYPLPPLSLET